MAMRFRIQALWAGRDEGVARNSHRLFTLVSALRGVDACFGQWLFFDVDKDQLEVLGDKARCQQALEQYAVEWQTGRKVNTSYKLTLHARALKKREPNSLADKPAAGGHGIAAAPADDTPAAVINLTCGIEVGEIPAFMPNRLELILEPWAGEHGADRPLVERLMRTVILAVQPDWAFAGTMDTPTPPVALFDSGAPVVGWMTYLSSRFPPLPTNITDPSEVHAVGRQGHLIIAHHNRFTPANPAHVAALQDVGAKLRQAGVLLTDAQLKARA